MANPDDLNDFNFEAANPHFSYGSRLSWPMQHPQPGSPSAASAAAAVMAPKRSTSPLPLSLETQSYVQQPQQHHHHHAHPHASTYPTAAMIPEWAQVTSQKEPISFQSGLEATSFDQQQPFDSYGASFQASPTDYIQPTTMETAATAAAAANLGADMSASLHLDGNGPYVPLTTTVGGLSNLSGLEHLGAMGAMGAMDQVSLQAVETMGQWTDQGAMYNTYQDMPDILAMQQQNSQSSHHAAQQQQQQQQQSQQAFHQVMGSVCGDAAGYLSDCSGSDHDMRSLSSSDGSYVMVDHHNHNHHPHHHHNAGGSPNMGFIFNPDQTLHPRTSSNSSGSSNGSPGHSHASIDVEAPHSASSPSTHSSSELISYSDVDHHYYDFDDRHSPITAAAALASALIPHPIETHTATTSVVPSTVPSPQRSPTSPVSRKQPRKQTLTKSSAVGKPTTAAVNARRLSNVNGKASGETEKKVGRRKGPLRPDQRKQASEIRKLGACIRCRFLKKTCDKGDPCGGCQPSHARLWLVPCTRIDIKDLNYFMKDWKADYERHVSLGFSVGNIKGFSDRERTLFVTHGYGHCLPVQAREVFVRDDRVFGVDWVEMKDGRRSEHEVNTARMSAGMEGVSAAMLSDYLDRHIDGGFEFFVDEFFEGTPFITEILKTVHKFWEREKVPVLRKALKLVLAYNLTQAVCLVKLLGSEEDHGFEGQITDDDSYWKGQTVAPVMINFQVKCAMAEMWRELQKEILDELSSLFSSIYSKDKLKHWPTIFMLASVLLIIWELMQFDCRYRIPDAAVVDKFCSDMEATPVGVIVGLFSAISQKVPAFSEWETHKHHSHLGSNPAVCQAMEEVREHVRNHDKYLRERPQATFDRNDFDCLSNKFVSKLVIRAH